MSLEAIASVVFSDYEIEKTKKDNYLNSRFGNIIAEFSDLSEGKLDVIRTKLLSGQHFTFRKVFEFVKKYCPDKFYTDKIDNAKPNRFYSVIRSEGEFIEKEEKKLNELETFDKSKLKKVLRNAYDARSRFVHSGERMHQMIIVGHYNRYPVIALKEIQQAYSSAVGSKIDYSSYVPPLLTLERLVSYSIVNFIGSKKD